MTFYDVIIYGSKIAGSVMSMTALSESSDIVDKWYKSSSPDFIKNSPTCEYCLSGHVYDGTNGPVWHTFLAREMVIREIEKTGNFKWRKKKGIGRRLPGEYLEEIAEAGVETWFTLELSEL